MHDLNPDGTVNLDVPDREWAAEQRAQAIVNCGLCDDSGYRNSTVCDHVDRAPIAHRGMARIRELMGWTDEHSVTVTKGDTQQTARDEAESV